MYKSKTQEGNADRSDLKPVLIERRGTANRRRYVTGEPPLRKFLHPGAATERAIDRLAAVANCHQQRYKYDGFPVHHPNPLLTTGFGSRSFLGAANRERRSGGSVAYISTHYWVPASTEACGSVASYTKVVDNLD